MGLFMRKTELDSNMNKEHFVLKIKVNNKKFIGYIWPSDNWVEVHCFDKVNYEIKKYDVNYKYKSVGTGGMNFCVIEKNQGDSRLKAKWAIFENRVHSFIIPRDKVIGDKKSISCNPTKEDYDRWNEWHAEDDYETEIWVEDLWCSWVDSHQGDGYVHYLNVKTGELEMYPVV